MPFLRHYQRHGRQYSQDEQSWFAGQPTLRRALQLAARAENRRGQRFHHQRRIRAAAIAAAEPALLGAQSAISATRTFPDLLATITAALERIPHIGELYRYDTAFRVGAFLGISPDAVYLHAGVREGARALRIRHTGASIPMSALPRSLRHLPPHEAEDFLCIYKHQIIRSCGCS